MKSAFLIFPSVLLMMFGFGCAHQSAPATKPNPAPAATNTSTPAVPQPATNTSTPAPAPTKKPRADLDFAEAAARPTSTLPGTGWNPLFNGKSLNGWKETDFAGRGEVSIEHNLLVLHTGDPFTGVNYTNNFPRSNYEVALEAMRVTGADFFCGLTVPVTDTLSILIVGGCTCSLMG